MRLHTVAFLVGSVSILISCGGSRSATLQQNGPAPVAQTTPAFVQTGSLVEAQVLDSAVQLPDGRALIVNGSNGGSPLSEAELFDPKSNRFTSLAASPRMSGTATLLPNGLVLVAGGFTDGVSGTPTNTAMLFDPTAGSFRPAGNMTSPRASQTATLLNDGTVLMAGGSSQTAEIYNPTANAFTPTGDMEAVRASHGATLLANGKVLISGGDATGSAELYDPVAGSFSRTGSLLIPRTGHTATLLPNGNVLLTGGVPGPDENNPNLKIDSRTETYNPNSGQFSFSGNLIQSRIHHTATLLKNGNVLLVGGWTTDSSGYYTTATAELYDTTTLTFALTSHLIVPRGLHTAVSLADGSVLVVGGTSSSDGPLSANEIYKP